MNNYYGGGYGYYPQTRYGQINNGIQWVLGIEGAKSFYVEPGKSVILMDSEQPKFYIKSADLAGMCSLKSYVF